MNKKKKAFKISFISLMLLLSGGIMAACSKAEADDPNVDVIERVLNLQFNGPDETMMKLLFDPQYEAVVDGKEVNEELDKYVSEVYGPYFTQFYLNTFIQTFGLQYPVLAHETNHKLNLLDVVIEKSDTAFNRYTFTATVGYLKDGEKEKTAEVSGIVLVSTKENGKIGKFEYGDDNGFLIELIAGE